MVRFDDISAAVADAAGARARQIIEILSQLDEQALLAPSALDGWSRLNVACHLRYGAETLIAMKQYVLAGLPTSYDPGGRARPRPGTLVPRACETPHDVVGSLAHHTET